MPSRLVGRIPVVFVLDNMRMGGTELNAIRTAALMDRERFDLRVVCATADGEGPLRARYEELGIPIETIPVRNLYGMSMLKSGYQLVRYLRTHRVRIVHSHDMYSNVFVAPWAQVARTPVVIASRRWWHSLPSGKLRYGNIAAFRMADAVLANSPQVARSVEESDGISPARIHVIPNFVDDTAFEPLSATERDAVRRAWGVARGAVVAGCVARLVPVKDHVTLLRGFARAVAAFPGAHLVLVGDGECRPALEALSTELGISQAVTFAGELRGGTNHHRAFDISVLCSLSEGFPNTLVEAMAAAAPIIATSVGGNVDAVTTGYNGVLVPSQHAAALSSALETLFRDESMRRAMGEAGRARAVERYRASAAIASLQGMYDRLLAKAAP